MPAPRRVRFPVGWLALDVVALWAAFIIAFIVRFAGHLPATNLSAFLRTAPWMTLGWLVLAHIYGMYDRRQPWTDVLQGDFLTTVLGTVLAMAISFVDRGFAFPRSILVIAGLLTFWIELGVRRILWLHERKRTRPMSAILLCTPEEAQPLRDHVQRSGEQLQIELRDVVTLSVGGAVPAFEPAPQERPEVEAVVLSAGLAPAQKEQAALMAFQSGYAVHVLPNVYEVLLARARVGQVGDTVALEIGGVQSTLDYEIIKRLIDVCVSLSALAVLALPMALLAGAIALIDGRPVVYEQKRVGRHGRTFRLFKFRTMIVGAEQKTGPVLALPADPRLTRLGGVLRTWHLDELPQLWNVLRGDMSLVGPRPERPELHAATVKDNPNFNLRLRVDAGLTGLAQVNGRYDTTPEEKLKHDLMYATRSSFLFDLSILLRTVKAVWKHRRAS